MILFTKISQYSPDVQTLIRHGFGNEFMTAALASIVQDVKLQMHQIDSTDYAEIGKEFMRLKATLDAWEDVLQASIYMTNARADQSTADEGTES